MSTPAECPAGRASEPSGVHRSVAAVVRPSSASTPRGRRLANLSLLALGVVFGDIGTSPLYALRECFSGPHAVMPSPQNVIGVLSLITWSLILIISVKYLGYVLRADNRGEGGVLALMALALGGNVHRARRRGLVLAAGLFGAALLYGDGMITPAISVLSAVEGLEVAAPALGSWVVPITVVILVGLFSLQRRGTGGVGRLFGPVTLLWFSVIAALGLAQISRRPEVLLALSPTYAASFFLQNGRHGVLTLAAVFLVVTGGEALYADMGHFGRRPIRLCWFAVVLPALLLNYFGQGALLLQDPTSAVSPFYRLVPRLLLYPAVVLATLATIIASQAVISGAFSLTRQAMMLGFWPRIQIDHTSDKQIGQIYISVVNWALLAATVAFAVGFGSSDGLACAYGIAVTSTMLITTALMLLVTRRRWGWGAALAGGVTALLLVPDMAFLTANLNKVQHGGWVPLAIAGGIVTLMMTWKRGRALLGERISATLMPLGELSQLITEMAPRRVPGSAVFMTSSLEGTPPALVKNLRHNHVLHEEVVLLTVVTEEDARVAEEERLEVEALGDGFWRVVGHYGFTEQPDVPELLSLAQPKGVRCEGDHTTFFLGRETVLARRPKGMALWREKLFAFMVRNAQRPMAYFGMPPEQVMEIGSQVEL